VLLDRARVLVIGTGPMGAATAKLAGLHGAHVTLAGHDRQRLDRALTDLRGGTAAAAIDGVVADVEDPLDARRLLHGINGLDHIAVFTGSSGVPASSVAATPLPVAQQAFGRFWASYNALQAAAGHLPPGGSVTLLSGSSSRRPVAGLAVWGTLHGAIEALARNAVLELAPVRVNTISPGGIGIGVDRQLTDHAGRAQDIAAMAIAVMANPAVTNALLDVDGGERLGTITR
jgi:NAD(P)-dependent dehydrogenase (short-subunit alcohol dehydrogenase family)